MGSWTSFQVDGYELLSTKSYADDETLSLFREANKRVRLRAIVGNAVCQSSWLSADGARAAVRADPNGRLFAVLPAGAAWEVIEEDSDCEDDDETITAGDAVIESNVMFTASAYVGTVAEIRDRLDAMGFTITAAKQFLTSYVAQQLADVDTLLQEEPDVYGILERDRAALLTLTFDEWLATFRWLKERGAHRVDERGDYKEGSLSGYFLQLSETTPLVRYLLDENLEHKFGFPYEDLRLLYRAALEVCDDDAEVMLDLSDVTNGGYYAELQPVVDEARDARMSRFPAGAATIVLTEGSTDQRALQGALRVLYPHLIDLYSFVDFDAMRVRGGAPALVAAVKTFAGAGVANRVIALFDNDTAAHNALRDLRTIELPASMRVLTLPTLVLATAYPTIGPVGQHLADVNGSAASIEMYFGTDVLRDDDGTLMPVRWTSMDTALQRYQGELRDKSLLQRRFAEKLERAERDPATMATQDWSGMRAVLDAVRATFV